MPFSPRMSESDGSGSGEEGVKTQQPADADWTSGHTPTDCPLAAPPPTFHPKWLQPRAMSLLPSATSPQYHRESLFVGPGGGSSSIATTPMPSEGVVVFRDVSSPTASGGAGGSPPSQQQQPSGLDLQERLATFRSRILALRCAHDLDALLAKGPARSGGAPAAHHSSSAPRCPVSPTHEEVFAPPSFGSTETKSTTGSGESHLCTELREKGATPNVLKQSSHLEIRSVHQTTSAPPTLTLTSEAAAQHHHHHHALNYHCSMMTPRNSSPPLDSTATSVDLLCVSTRRTSTNDNSFREATLGGTNRSCDLATNSTSHSRSSARMASSSSSVFVALQGFLEAFDQLFLIPKQQFGLPPPSGLQPRQHGTTVPFTPPSELDVSPASGDSPPTKQSSSATPNSSVSSTNATCATGAASSASGSLTGLNGDSAAPVTHNVSSEPSCVPAATHATLTAENLSSAVSQKRFASLRKRRPSPTPEPVTTTLLRSASYLSNASRPGALRLNPQVLVMPLRSNQIDLFGSKVLNDEYLIVRLIGLGAQGKVKLAQKLSTKEFVAIKIFRRSHRHRLMNCKRAKHTPICASAAAAVAGADPSAPLHDTVASLAETEPDSEVQIMRRLQHRNIIPISAVLTSPLKLYIVMLYVPGGCLFKVLSDGTISCDVFSWDRARYIIRQLTHGLQYLHRHCIIHRDVKPENILVTESDRIFLTDFGVAEMFDEDETPVVYGTIGTPAFFAPEILNYNEDTTASSATTTTTTASTVDHQPEWMRTGAGVGGPPVDVWALGVTAYCMLFGHLPYRGNNTRTIREAQQRPLSFPPETDPRLIDFLQRVLHKDPRRRLTLREIRSHPWVVTGDTAAGPASPPATADAAACGQIDPPHQSSPPKPQHKRSVSVVSTAASLDATVAYHSRSALMSSVASTHLRSEASLFPEEEDDPQRGSQENAETVEEEEEEEAVRDDTALLCTAMKSMLLLDQHALLETDPTTPASSPSFTMKEAERAHSVAATPPRPPSRHRGGASASRPSFSQVQTLTEPRTDRSAACRARWSRITCAVLVVVRLCRASRRPFSRSPSSIALLDVLPPSALRPPLAAITGPLLQYTPQPPMSPSSSSSRGRSPSHSSMTALAPPFVDSTQVPFFRSQDPSLSSAAHPTNVSSLDELSPNRLRNHPQYHHHHLSPQRYQRRTSHVVAVATSDVVLPPPSLQFSSSSENNNSPDAKVPRNAPTNSSLLG